MPRSVEEWFGATDDSMPPGYVRLRIVRRFGGQCPKCTRSLKHVAWDCDHIVALTNGGENRESNLQPLCASPCHSNKTKSDRRQKGKTDHALRSQYGIKKPRTITGWRRFDGTPVSASRGR
jgi:5-methylcytosine-specific restriction endonuclease McrA